MTTIGEAVIIVRADGSSIQSDVQSAASPSRMGRLGGVAGKALGLGFAAAAGAVIGAGAFLKGAFDEAEEARKVGALTESTIKATGGAANVSAEQVGNLAGAISAKVGVDDEAIQSGANLLLTFKNIRNEAGKGNEIFDRATQSAVDLSAAGFGSIESASKTMGKALNDPIKGVSALGKSGVTFSEDQKAMIESLVESGDVLGAQKIILKEVEGQVGGAAEAQATAGDKMKVAWGNLKEEIGTALLPVMDRLASFITSKLLPATAQIGPIMSAIKTAIAPTIAAISGFISGLSGNGPGGAGGLGVKMQELKGTFMSVFANVKTIVADAVSIVKSLWATFGSTIVSFTRSYFTNAMQIIRGVFNVIAGIFKTVSALLKGDWRGVWEGIKQIVKGAAGVITGVVKQFWNLISSIFKASGQALKAAMSAVWNGIKTVISNAFNGYKSLISKGVDNIVNLIKGIPDKIRQLGSTFLAAGKDVMGKIFDGIRAGAGGVGDFITSIASAIKGAINNALGLPFTINGPGPLPDFTIPAFARGGTTPGGAVLVGEEGPEYVNLPRGSYVNDAQKTARMARANSSDAARSGGGGSLRIVEGTLDISPSGKAFIRGLAVEEIEASNGFAAVMAGMK